MLTTRRVTAVCQSSAVGIKPFNLPAVVVSAPDFLKLLQQSTGHLQTKEHVPFPLGLFSVICGSIDGDCSSLYWYILVMITHDFDHFTVFSFFKLKTQGYLF